MVGNVRSPEICQDPNGPDKNAGAVHPGFVTG